MERLHLLGLLTRSGHRIGDVANLPTEVLRARVAESETPTTQVPATRRTFGVEAALDDALDAVRAMDAGALSSILFRSALALGQRGLLLRFISPLSRRIGELWANGSMTAAHEHFASGELRTFLLRTSHEYLETVRAPVMIATTPAGQLHELGAAIVTAAARELGWRVIYLGPNLPAADIAHAAEANDAKLIALSIVYPADDNGLAAELALLRKLVPEGIPIIAGGVAAAGNLQALRGAGIEVLDDLEEFSGKLVELRG